MAGTQQSARSWWLDAITALAFFGLALFLGRSIGRVVPFAGLFVFLVNAGLGYWHARAAWRGLLNARGGGR
jgi:hypothetical protein